MILGRVLTAQDHTAGTGAEPAWSRPAHALATMDWRLQVPPYSATPGLIRFHLFTGTFLSLSSSQRAGLLLENCSLGPFSHKSDNSNDNEHLLIT